VEILDISMVLEDKMPVYPGDPYFESKVFSSIVGGDPVNLTKLCLGSHSGTHIDAPKHFYQNGQTIDQLSLADLSGVARVIDVGLAKSITAEILARHHIKKGERLLLKTANSRLPLDKFYENYVYLEEEAAAYLVERSIKLVGIDYLSIGKFKSESQVHQLLLGAEVVIVEGLRLAQVKPGTYLLICLPLKLVGIDGAPARAILIKKG
jgi:arylformamidase